MVPLLDGLDREWAGLELEMRSLFPLLLFVVECLGFPDEEGLGADLRLAQYRRQDQSGLSNLRVDTMQFEGNMMAFNIKSSLKQSSKNRRQSSLPKGPGWAECSILTLTLEDALLDLHPLQWQSKLPKT